MTLDEIFTSTMQDFQELQRKHLQLLDKYNSLVKATMEMVISNDRYKSQINQIVYHEQSL